MLTLYGIKNCDTVRKARRWLEEQGVAYHFHDVRADGLEPALLGSLADRLGWEQLLNRRSSTYRQLPEERTADLDAERALALMLEQPTLLKRPVAARGDQARVGFNESDWQAWLLETA
jgi:arsenate reductase